MKNFKKTILFTVLTLLAMGTSLSYARFEGTQRGVSKRNSGIKNRYSNMQIRKAGFQNKEVSPEYAEGEEETPPPPSGNSDCDQSAYDACLQQNDCDNAPNAECDDNCAEGSGCQGDGSDIVVVE